jgi:hypothetical protein
MASSIKTTDVIGVETEHNPTLHLWLLSLSIMAASVSTLFLVASIFALNIATGMGSFMVVGLSVWAIKAIIDHMKWH